MIFKSYIRYKSDHQLSLFCFDLKPSSREMESDPNPHDPSPAGGGEEAKKGLVVLLVGAPGSGKSTFCNDVMAAARRPWVRVCQVVPLFAFSPLSMDSCDLIVA